MKLISLDKNWNLTKLTRAGFEKDVNLSLDIPCTVFEALIMHNVIEDPFYGENEHKTAWVYESDWVYETVFDIPEEVYKYDNIVLKFNGLDSISEIFLNEQELGSTNNMFRFYEFNVKKILKKSKNKLKIIFQSPTRKARDEVKKYGYRMHFVDYLPGIQFLRKAQYSFGWDWGPKLPDIGIWKPIELIGFEKVRLNSIYVKQDFTYNKDPLKISIEDIIVKEVNLEFVVELKPDNLSEQSFDSQNEYLLEVNIIAPNGEKKSDSIIIKDKMVIFNLTIPNPQLWWIYELGKPLLYEVQVIIKKNEKIIDSKVQKLGIREIRLIRRSDKWGETFYFRLNGVPIFAKGANWIPIDSFIHRGKKLDLYSLNLKYAKEANMNMLRVWGGGIYEDDDFYSLCDELGILIWQDFTFACNLYPYHEEFIENFKEEAIQNIKRIRHHPSLALWCGNNEMEWFLGLYLLFFTFNFRKRSKYRKGYFHLFEEIIPKLVKKYDPQHDYWPSSPSSGAMFGKGGRGLLKSNSPDIGDSHYWMVWHMGKPFTAYRKFYSRFMSEYGFESFPSIKTVAKFCPPNQFDMYSPIMKNHQKNPAGNKKIMKYMKRRFKIPKDFKKQVILSQIAQAEAIEYGVEHWRCNRNNYRCMGSLYWQLNDCWPVISWSSLDFFCNWKALHYVAKRFYQSFFPIIVETKQEVTFYLVNDLQYCRKGKLKWIVQNSDGLKYFEGEKTIEVPPCTAFEVKRINTSQINKNKKELRNNIIFIWLYDEKGQLIHEKFRLFDSPKYFTLKDPRLYWELRKISENLFELIINTQEIALFVHINFDKSDFIASDNFFSLNKDESYKITLKFKNKQMKDKLIANLKVDSLYDLMKN
ncbi:MAG: glycosyl hydrolase 2 galactose-binding domain-containing protein [Candidatus Helarchaeota archaeon]